MQYAYMVFDENNSYIPAEVFLGNAEDNSDVEDYCRAIDAKFTKSSHHRYTITKGRKMYFVIQMAVTQR